MFFFLDDSLFCCLWNVFRGVSTLSSCTFYRRKLHTWYVPDWLVRTTNYNKAMSTLSRINLKTQLLLQKQIKCSPSTLIVFSATFISKQAIQSDNRHNNIINNSSTILDQWLKRDCDRVTWLLWRQRFQKVPFSLSTLTHLAGVFKFIPFGERFQKVSFSDNENAV